MDKLRENNRFARNNNKEEFDSDESSEFEYDDATLQNCSALPFNQEEKHDRLMIGKLF